MTETNSSSPASQNGHSAYEAYSHYNEPFITQEPYSRNNVNSKSPRQDDFLRSPRRTAVQDGPRSNLSQLLPANVFQSHSNAHPDHKHEEMHESTSKTTNAGADEPTESKSVRHFTFPQDALTSFRGNFKMLKEVLETLDVNVEIDDTQRSTLERPLYWPSLEKERSASPINCHTNGSTRSGQLLKEDLAQTYTKSSGQYVPGQTVITRISDEVGSDEEISEWSSSPPIGGSSHRDELPPDSSSPQQENGQSYPTIRDRSSNLATGAGNRFDHDGSSDLEESVPCAAGERFVVSSDRSKAEESYKRRKLQHNENQLHCEPSEHPNQPVQLHPEININLASQDAIPETKGSKTRDSNQTSPRVVLANGFSISQIAKTANHTANSKPNTPLDELNAQGEVSSGPASVASADVDHESSIGRISQTQYTDTPANKIHASNTASIEDPAITARKQRSAFFEADRKTVASMNKPYVQASSSLVAETPKWTVQPRLNIEDSSQPRELSKSPTQPSSRSPPHQISFPDTGHNDETEEPPDVEASGSKSTSRSKRSYGVQAIDHTLDSDSISGPESIESLHSLESVPPDKSHRRSRDDWYKRSDTPFKEFGRSLASLNRIRRALGNPVYQTHEDGVLELDGAKMDVLNWTL